MPTVGVGICTYQRPGLWRRCAESVALHLPDAFVCSWHDGPLPKGYEDPPVALHVGDTNRGVAHAKNRLLEALLAAGCEWLVLCEDDLEVTSPAAVDGYVEACRRSGWQHLNFHGHGVAHPAEPAPGDPTDGVDYWASYCGAWTVTSRAAVEQVGLLDEAFWNVYEHVVWTLEMARAGFTSGWRRCADAAGSLGWLREQTDGRDGSVIAQDPDLHRHTLEAREHWRVTYPWSFAQVLGG